MPKALRRKSIFKLLKFEKNQWELWLFVVSLVTILGFFVQTHKHIDSDLAYNRSQSKAEVYDMRLPNNSRIVQDRLETGR